MVTHWTEYFNTQPLHLHRSSRKYRPRTALAQVIQYIVVTWPLVFFLLFPNNEEIFWWQMLQKQGRSEAYCQAVIKQTGSRGL